MRSPFGPAAGPATAGSARRTEQRQRLRDIGIALDAWRVWRLGPVVIRMQRFAGNVLIVRFGWRVAWWIERQRLATLRRRGGISWPGWGGIAGVWIVWRFAGLHRRQRARFDRSGPDCGRRRSSRQRLRPALRHEPG